MMTRRTTRGSRKGTHAHRIGGADFLSLKGYITGGENMFFKNSKKKSWGTSRFLLQLIIIQSRTKKNEPRDNRCGRSVFFWCFLPSVSLFFQYMRTQNLKKKEKFQSL